MKIPTLFAMRALLDDAFSELELRFHMFQYDSAHLLVSRERASQRFTPFIIILVSLVIGRAFSHPSFFPLDLF